MSHIFNRLHDKETLDLFLELIGQINSETEINYVLLNIINAAKIITDSEACSVFLIDEVTDELILSIPTGPARNKLTGKAFPREEGIAGWVAEQAKSQIVNNVTKDKRFRGDFNPEVFKTRNIICAPLITQSRKVIGVLQAINKKDGGKYHEGELPLFEALATHAAIAIANARLHEEKSTLLSEIHHRVKNNMAVVSSLIQLQAMQELDEDVQSKLFNNVARISSMAIVHEQLYKSESFSRIDFAENIEKIVTNTIQNLHSKTKISTCFECDKFDLNINQSIPCSLIVNEVIIRLIKSGFCNMDEAEIFLKLKEDQKAGLIVLTLIDNGHPIHNRAETPGEEDAYLQFIDILSKQLKGSYHYDTVNGKNRFEITFQKSDASGAGNYAL